MRIRILTFHWAANHGAVLQTYATYSYLKEVLGITDVKVIDYLHKSKEINFKALLKPQYPSVMLSKFKSIMKEKKIKSFRNNFELTNRYYSNKDLIDDPPDCDIIFAGSDQIWNPGYVLYGEGKITPVYFLNFCKKKCKKVGLSVSFGCVEYPEKAAEIVKPLVTDFDAIGVREKTGIEVLNKMGVKDAVVVADPTALLSRNKYLQLCSDIEPAKTPYTGICILRGVKGANKKRLNELIAQLGNKSIDIENTSVEKWLSGIRDADFIITNSFHCVMMCLKLHTPFAVIVENGELSGMNDRFFTLLEHFDLGKCIIKGTEDIENIKNYFEWEKIDALMEEYSLTLKNFIKDQVLGEK